MKGSTATAGYPLYPVFSELRHHREIQDAQRAYCSWRIFLHPGTNVKSLLLCSRVSLSGSQTRPPSLPPALQLQMLEAPATAQDEVTSKEHGEATDTALLYGGVAPHPAFVHRSQESH